jgi:hypothetical protein
MYLLCRSVCRGLLPWLADLFRSTQRVMIAQGNQRVSTEGSASPHVPGAAHSQMTNAQTVHGWNPLDARDGVQGDSGVIGVLCM